MTAKASTSPPEQDGLFAAPPPDMLRGAVLSPDGAYRYELTRLWDRGRARVAFVMLNPSTADAAQDDNTIRRCIGFAKAWGFGSLVVRNLYALRSTDPAALWSHPDPIGPHNRGYLNACALDELVVAAWGAHGAKAQRGLQVAQQLDALDVRLHYLELTNAGEPKHPLYIKGNRQPREWTNAVWEEA